MSLTSAQRHALAHVDAIQPDLSAWTSTIFDFGETAWREYKSVDWYVRTLRANGFTVEEGPFAARRWIHDGSSTIGRVTSFGEDGAGELYVVNEAGTVYRMVRK